MNCIITYALVRLSTEKKRKCKINGIPFVVLELTGMHKYLLLVWNLS